MVALLPYRGNERDNDKRCPIDIAGLAKLGEIFKGFIDIRGLVHGAFINTYNFIAPSHPSRR